MGASAGPTGRMVKIFIKTFRLLTRVHAQKSVGAHTIGWPTLARICVANYNRDANLGILERLGERGA